METLNRRLSGGVAVSVLAFLIIATSSSSAYAINYGYDPTSSIATAQTPTVPLQPGTVGSPTVSLGVYATVTVASSSLALYYVPVTLTNCNTCAATPNPLQTKVTWNPTDYTAYEAANLGNIRFCADTGCVAMLYAWLESCASSCSTGAATASAWVKLNSPIAANGGTLTIYMAFLSETATFDGNYWGEAPSLSATYGQYDNGANVFSIYFNGNTPTSSFTLGTGSETLSQKTGITYGSTTISVLSLTAVAKYSAMSFATGITPGGYVTETNVEANSLGGETLDYAGLVNSPTATSLSNGIGGGQVGSHPFGCVYWSSGAEHSVATTTQVSTSTWYYVDVIYSGTSAGSFTSDLYSALYSTPIATETANVNPLSSVATFYFGLPTGNGGATGTTLYYNWGRVRAYPPGGVLPAVGFGSVSRGAVLTFTNSGSTSWLANLVVYSSTNAARLNNLTASFQSPLSQQVVLGTAVTNQNIGPQVMLAGSATLSIILGVTVNSAGTSTVTLGFKIQSPPASGQASVYCYGIISLTVN